MKNLFVVVIVSSLSLAGCGGSQETSQGPSSSQDKNTAPPSDRPQQASGEIQVLKVYGDGSPVLNTIDAVNLTKGNHFFDFTYQADQDEALILAHLKPGPLLGCGDSDIGIEFRLYNVDSSGHADVSSSQGIPQAVGIEVKSGRNYIVRGIFQLDKDCLGISYQFGIHTSR